MSAGVTRGKWNQYEQATSAKLQAQSDYLSASLLDILYRLLAVRDGYMRSGVVDGFCCSAQPGTMNVRITTGLAFLHAVGVSESDFSVSHCQPLLGRGLADAFGNFVVQALDPGDGQDRIDVVYLTPAETDANQQTVQIYQGGTGPWVGELKYMETRNSPAVGVVKGTPGTPPVAPAVPGTAVALYEVLVPAGATNLDAATLTDVRVRLGHTGGLGHVPPWAAGRFLGATGDVQGVAFNIASVVRVSAGVYTVNLTSQVPSDVGTVLSVQPYHVIVATPVPVVAVANCNSILSIYIATFDLAGNPIDPFSVQFRLDLLRR